jgi:hypothetical protein
VHAGETADTDEGPVGSAVNLAARICSQARPGEVLVSDTVRALVRTSLPVAFSERGRRSLKGVGEPVRLWAVSPSDEIARAVPRVGLGRTLHGIRPGIAGSLIAGAAIVVLVGAIVLRPGSDEPGGSPSPLGGSPPASTAGAAGGGSPTDLIVYARRSFDVEGLLDCYGNRPGRTTHISELRLVGGDGSGDRRMIDDSRLFEYEPDARADGSTITFVGDSSGT